MRVLMLGWEFPPRIAGGLGVACHGLTRALDHLGHEVIFVLPTSPRDLASGATSPHEGSRSFMGGVTPRARACVGFRFASFLDVPSRITNPYGGVSTGTVRVVLVGELSPESNPAGQAKAEASAVSDEIQVLDPLLAGRAIDAAADETESLYAFEDVADETERYMRLVVSMAHRERFDVIHAHDWPTFAAGAALAQVTGKPLVVHVHSTEFDRSPGGINHRLADLEKAGVMAADRVIAVSQLTKGVLVRKYGVSPAKVDVVYNGIDRGSAQRALPEAGREKVVLFVGRLTGQKGPEYFIAAAQRVLEKIPDVKFVLAGSGDLMLKLATLATSMGIGKHVHFTGFLSPAEMDKVYTMADCFVMPSVSEPFGLAALEAIDHDVPAIVSRSSGAGEVLRHVLKVDFHDTQEMASKIVSVLTRPALGQTLRANASLELHTLTWDAAAKACVGTYQRAIDARR